MRDNIFFRPPRLFRITHAARNDRSPPALALEQQPQCFEDITLISDSAFNASKLQIYDREGNERTSLREEFTTEHPVQAELRDWLAALRDEAPIPIPGEEGLATVALAQAAYTSAESGQLVRYSLDV